jgi:hypothetical protein
MRGKSKPARVSWNREDVCELPERQYLILSAQKERGEIGREALLERPADRREVLGAGYYIDGLELYQCRTRADILQR